MPWGLFSCLASKPDESPVDKGIKIANLSTPNAIGLDAIQEAFSKANQGYDIAYKAEINSIDPFDQNRVLFIQSGGGTATMKNGKSSKFSIGDIIILKPGEQFATDSLFSTLIFQTPDEPSNGIPTFVRPDWDENITDIPGGCATETNAYRRILLTWKEEVGQYVYHSLNAHRVRIMDSFTHFHPVHGGFDEFYLVQMALPNARLITSTKVSQIQKPQSITLDQAKGLVQETSLNVGDLIYIPRGVMHRGLGGVLAQVITVPGFVPGAEIGVDHHLKNINDHLKLEGDQLIPYNVQASAGPIIK